MRSKKKMQAMLLVIGILLVGVTIAYAALSATLNITVNKVTQNVVSFGVEFQNTGSNIQPTAIGGTSDTGRDCGTATVTATTVTIADTQLSKPDDKCQYTLTLKNIGSVTAKLDSIVPINPTGTSCSTSSGARMICGSAANKSITYSLRTSTSTSGTSNLVTTSNSTLSSFAPNATYTIYLIAMYTGTALNSSAVTQTGAAFTLNWAQK